MNTNAQNSYNLIVGTYTNSCESKGMYIYDFNVLTGEFTQKAASENTDNPSYLTVSPDKKNIYAVNESGKESTVSAFAFTPLSGKLKFLNKKDAKGEDPCFIISDAKHIITANYASGSISVFGKNADGTLTEAKQVIKHKGKGADKDRQEGAHAHTVYFSPDKEFIFANDLGTDKIYIYKYNPEEKDKILVLKEAIAVKPRSGPRHLAFHPNGIFMYVVNELDATITAFMYNKHKLTKIHEASIAAVEPECKNAAADIKISPDGKFLYATNRGDANTITVFKIHANGRLAFVDQYSTLGEEPRNFAIDPKGNFLLVGNQKSNAITIFKRDKLTGKLTDTTKKIELCAPACLVFTEGK